MTSGSVTAWQRMAAATWDHQFLRVQHAVYRIAPRLAAHLDELARRRDDALRRRGDSGERANRGAGQGAPEQWDTVPVERAVPLAG